MADSQIDTQNDSDKQEDILMRACAYYYGFSFTGVDEIDRILAAVACAGKAFHHTESWSDPSHKIDSYLEGRTPEEWIQKAADKAARAFLNLGGECE